MLFCYKGARADPQTHQEIINNRLSLSLSLSLSVCVCVCARACVCVLTECHQFRQQIDWGRMGVYSIDIMDYVIYVKSAAVKLNFIATITATNKSYLGYD